MLRRSLGATGALRNVYFYQVKNFIAIKFCDVGGWRRPVGSLSRADLRALNPAPQPITKHSQRSEVYEFRIAGRR